MTTANKAYAQRLQAAGFSDKQVIDMLVNALDAHGEIIDDYEAYLARRLNVTTDRVHLVIKMGKEWVDALV